ncbi:MAG: hypothetical protein LBW85_03415, partial [Deltaproteobacteria bacterium]|nr:hypothetical protein [Deltaproteobacteria bacterium]
MIVSSIPGRVRLRSENLKDPDLSLDDLAQCPGILSYALNTLTGSLLVEYDPAALSPFKAAQILSRLDPGALEQYAEHVRKTGAGPAETSSGSPSPSRPAGRRPPAPVRGEAPPPPSRSRNPVIRPDVVWNEAMGLGASLLAVLISGFIRRKRFHVIAGMAFIELTLAHVWRYRKR